MKTRNLLALLPTSGINVLSNGFPYLWHTSSNLTGLPTGIGTVTGQGTSKLTIAGVNASTAVNYECDVTIGSATLTLSTHTARIGLKPVIVPITAQTLRVGEDIGSLYIDTGDATSATITGLPAGLKYTFANGQITGAPTTATALDEPAVVVITAKNANGSSTFAFAFTVNPLATGIVGAWAGVLDRGGDPTALGGKVTLNVTASGAVTGTVINGATTFPLKTNVVSTSAASSVNIDVSNALFTKTVHLVLDTDVLTGTVGSASARGRRNPWNALNPVAIIGSFNCKFSPNSIDLAAPEFPHGHSVAVLTLTNLGAVTAAFHLADNTVITATSSRGGNGDAPLFVPLYTSTGAALGTLHIVSRDVTGTLGWNKHSTTASVAYKAGFSARDLTCTGKRYVKPNAAFNEYFSGLAAGASNAHLAASDGVLTMTSTTPITVTLTGIATESNPDLTLALTTGVAKGNLTLHGTDTTTSKAVARIAPYYALAIPAPA